MASVSGLKSMNRRPARVLVTVISVPPPSSARPTSTPVSFTANSAARDILAAAYRNRRQDRASAGIFPSPLDLGIARVREAVGCRKQSLYFFFRRDIDRLVVAGRGAHADPGGNIVKKYSSAHHLQDHGVK